jgi:Iap family predicted aminopeptidase
VPGANDNASGVAAVLCLAERFAAQPLDHTDVVVAFTGAEEAGMGGMRAFLDAHQLDQARTLVVGLDTVGSGTPIVAQAEGALLAHRYAEEDVARVAPEVERWRVGGYTDPILARFRGIPAVSILSVSPQTGMYTRYHRMDDVPEHVDLACVERCAQVAEATARAFSAR